MESYSPSIQKLCVFLKSQSDITNNGISYLNNFLTDLSNAIIVESIHSSKSHKHKTILIEDIESGLNVVFPSEIADAIINQSKGRIQHTSMKNLMQVKTFGTNQNLSSSIDSTTNNIGGTGGNSSTKNEDLDLDDSDVEGFEIIPNNNSIYAHDVSPCFPVELVYKVTADYISRKKLIHANPSDFYSVLEQQDSNHVIYTFISYALENITTKILNRISSLDIDEDVIRQSIQENPTLSSIRHKVIQASNISNRLLGATTDVKDLPTSLSNSFIYSQSTNSNNSNNSLSNSQSEYLISDTDDSDIENFNKNSIIINDDGIGSVIDKKLVDQEKEINQQDKNQENINSTLVIDNSNNSSNSSNNNNNNNNSNNNNNNNINNNNNNIISDNSNTETIEQINNHEDLTKSVVNSNNSDNNNVQNSNKINVNINQSIKNNSDSVNNNNNNNSNNIKLNEEKLLNNIKSILNSTNKDSNKKVYEDFVASSQTMKRRVPNLFRVEEPVDLVQVFINGVHLEITNGMFLVLLVLVGFALQNFVKVN